MHLFIGQYLAVLSRPSEWFVMKGEHNSALDRLLELSVTPAHQLPTSIHNVQAENLFKF